MRLSKLTPEIYAHIYRDNVEFRDAFDLQINDAASLDAAQDALHTSLVIEELTELAQAKSKIEQADAIVDAVYVLMGRLVHLGHDTLAFADLTISYLVDILLNIAANLDIDFIACWDEIQSSNMSKLCKNWQEFVDTKEHYAKQGISISPIAKGNGFIAKCDQDFISQTKIVRKGKVLKSIYYRPADLTSLI